MPAGCFERYIHAFPILGIHAACAAVNRYDILEDQRMGDSEMSR